MIADHSHGLPLYLDLSVMRFLEIRRTNRTPEPAEFDHDFPALIARTLTDLTPDERHVLRSVALLDSFDLNLATRAAGMTHEAPAMRLAERPFVRENPFSLRRRTSPVPDGRRGVLDARERTCRWRAGGGPGRRGWRRRRGRLRGQREAGEGGELGLLGEREVPAGLQQVLQQSPGGSLGEDVVDVRGRHRPLGPVGVGVEAARCGDLVGDLTAPLYDHASELTQQFHKLWTPPLDS
ncbi:MULTISPECIES: hypothetical protein [unclassified Streptomyces]|uniref:hypothetical protein n=1 Tax=unclassified Streptomyces TaxID=2593676 RepID=UPI002E1E24EB